MPWLKYSKSIPERLGNFRNMQLYRSFLDLRWLAFIAQLVVLFLAVGVFGLTLPWSIILLLILLIPVSNLALARWNYGAISEKNVIGAVLALDTLLLTALLALAGGPTNPFTIIYLLHVVISAVVLTRFWTWSIALLSSFLFSLLFLFSLPVPEWSLHGDHGGLSLHLHGMLIAYVVVALLVAYFLDQIIDAKQEAERKFHQLQALAANQRQLALLTTITAGAAHELGTPLATIALVSSELERALSASSTAPAILEDIALLKQETKKCKDILEALSAKSGDVLGEAPQWVEISQLVNDALRELNAAEPPALHGELDIFVEVPRKALTVAIRALIKNALEASAGVPHSVNISALRQKDRVTLTIEDHGCGMNQDTLERIGEPFFSTKATGLGMGLGVYLSKMTVQQIGGDLCISSVSGVGTQATISFPLEPNLNRIAI